jgi:hypothetical protein
MRLVLIRSFLFFVGGQPACGSRGLAATQAVVDGGQASVDSGPPAMTVEDTGTLDVSIVISAVAQNGETRDTVQTEISVSVNDATTGTPVADADVGVDPVGRAASFLPALSLLSKVPGQYYGTIIGYAGAWQFSIVRGVDHVKGLVIVGPSYPTLSVTIASAGVSVGWSPALEAHVTNDACAFVDPPLPNQVGQWCVNTGDPGGDPGSIVLTTADANESTTMPFPVRGQAYVFHLLRMLDQPLGAKGTKSVEVEPSGMEFGLPSAY